MDGRGPGKAAKPVIVRRRLVPRPDVEGYFFLDDLDDYSALSDDDEVRHHEMVRYYDVPRRPTATPLRPDGRPRRGLRSVAGPRAQRHARPWWRFPVL